MELLSNCCNPRNIKWNPLNISEAETDIGFTNRFLTKGGKPWIPVAAEFHFSRFPHGQWEIEILKMKACGIMSIIKETIPLRILKIR